MEAYPSTHNPNFRRSTWRGAAATKSKTNFDHEAREEHEGREHFLDSMPFPYPVFVSFEIFVVRDNLPEALPCIGSTFVPAQNKDRTSPPKNSRGFT